VNIEIRDEGGVSVLQLVGRLDTNTSPEAQKTLNEHIDGGAAKLVLVFTQLDYISSAGVQGGAAAGQPERDGQGDLRRLRFQRPAERLRDPRGSPAGVLIQPDLQPELAVRPRSG
jgi:anti-anti-sigma factor